MHSISVDIKDNELVTHEFIVNQSVEIPYTATFDDTAISKDKLTVTCTYRDSTDTLEATLSDSSITIQFTKVGTLDIKLSALVNADNKDHTAEDTCTLTINPPEIIHIIHVGIDKSDTTTNHEIIENKINISYTASFDNVAISKDKLTVTCTYQDSTSTLETTLSDNDITIDLGTIVQLLEIGPLDPIITLNIKLSALVNADNKDYTAEDTCNISVNTDDWNWRILNN